MKSQACVGDGRPGRACPSAVSLEEELQLDFISSKDSYFGETCLKCKRDFSQQPLQIVVLMLLLPTGPSGGSRPEWVVVPINQQKFSERCV